MYDTAFTLSIFKGLFFVLLLILLAGPMAKFYGEPRLFILICVLSLTNLFYSTISPRTVEFMKQMDFRRDFLMDVSGKIFALIIATWIAVTTRSYWAIAAATLTTPIVMTAVSYWVAPYKPRITLSDWPLFKDMVGWHTLSQVIFALNWQISRILLGRFVPTNELGQFAIADDLVAVPTKSVLTPLERPLMANFAMCSDDNDLRQRFDLAQNAVFGSVAPVFISLCLLAGPVVWILFGQKWMGAVPIIRWLSFAALFFLPVACITPLAMSMNKTRYVTIIRTVELCIKLPAILVGLYYYGLTGALYAILLSMIGSFIVSFFIVKRLLGSSIGHQVSLLLRGVIAGAGLAVTLFILRPDFGPDYMGSKVSLVFQLFICLAVGGIVYFSVLFILWALSGRPKGVESVILDQIQGLRQKLSEH